MKKIILAAGTVLALSSSFSANAEDTKSSEYL